MAYKGKRMNPQKFEKGQIKIMLVLLPLVLFMRLNQWMNCSRFHLHLSFETLQSRILQNWLNSAVPLVFHSAVTCSTVCL